MLQCSPLPSRALAQGNPGQELTLKMKNSSMNMAPKGRIPAIRILQSERTPVSSTVPLLKPPGSTRRAPSKGSAPPGYQD